MKTSDIKLYILEAIDLGEYIERHIVPGVGTVSALLDNIYDLFIKDKTPVKVRKDEKKELIDWYSGMPSYFNIEMDNYRQDILLKEWDAEGKEFNDVIYETFIQMLDEYGISRVGRQ